MKHVLRVAFVIMMLALFAIIPCTAATTTPQTTTQQIPVFTAIITMAQIASPPAASEFAAQVNYSVFAGIKALTQKDKTYLTLMMIKSSGIAVAVDIIKYAYDDVGYLKAATPETWIPYAAETDTHDIQMIVKTMDSGLIRQSSGIYFSDYTVGANQLPLATLDSGQKTNANMDITGHQGAVSSQILKVSNLSQQDAEKTMTAAYSQAQVSVKENAAGILNVVNAVGTKVETSTIARIAEIGTGFALVAA